VILQIEDLRAGYGSIEVLHGASLSVAPGTVAAVIGTNGAGKTTLLRTVAGLLPARSGRIVFDGRDITGDRDSSRARAGLCLIPEGRGIYRQLTVAENVAMFVRGRGVDAAVERAAAVFPVLGQRRGQTAGTLSGGEQQMLAVSRALVTRPRLVMVDELSVGLSPVAIDAIFAAVDVLRADGVSLLVVEQYLDRALDISDRVFFLRKGSLRFEGGPAAFRDTELLRRLHLGVTVGGAA
jgi:branched-chain amino acid transport system ATP-binding protein